MRLLCQQTRHTIGTPASCDCDCPNKHGPMGDTYTVEWVNKGTSPKEKVLIPNSGVSSRKEGDHKKYLD